MTEKRPFGLPSAKLIAVAAVAGIVAGAAAVYVKETGSGKVETAANECQGEAVTAEALKAFTTGEVAAMVAADPPRKMAGLAFVDAGEKPMTLDDFAGKTVLLNLWATWCVPCREEMPALNALQEDKGGNDFQVLAINIDTGDAGKPQEFLTETGVDSLGLYRDSSMGVFNVLKKEGLVLGLPATLLIDDKGCLLGAMNGPAAWDSADAKALIDAAVTR